MQQAIKRINAHNTSKFQEIESKIANQKELLAKLDELLTHDVKKLADKIHFIDQTSREAYAAASHASKQRSISDKVDQHMY